MRVCLWNIHGATITKLETHEHLLDLFQHVDVVALTETHHFLGDTFPVLLGFCCFDVSRPVTPQGVVQKHSGGIAEVPQIPKGHVKKCKPNYLDGEC